MKLHIKHAYEPSAAEDGERFLVDRLWPRGVKKEGLALTGWLKEADPSAKLRGWFGHNPAWWDAFRRNYRKELEAHPEVLEPLREALQRGVVTLVYSARDQAHNQAVALCQYLLESGSSSRGTRHRALAPS